MAFVVVVVIALVVAVLIMGAAPMVRRTADARETKRPRDEGDLL
jgi:hypothetical protein